MMAATALVAACESSTEPGVVGTVEGFAGLVAGDEPRAVVIGRELLGNGGTAIDAAISMTFTMMVTMPSRVGVGGGGVCVVFDPGYQEENRPVGEIYEFLNGRAPGAGLAPRTVRAMAALHASRGILRWETLLTPAENMARFGHPISRAFARDIADANVTISRDAALLRSLAAPSGKLAVEGDKIVQSELSGVIGGIRRQGAGYFYSGPFAARFERASEDAGLPVSRAELRASRPNIGPAAKIPVGSYYAYLPAPPTDGGVVTGQMWRILAEREDYASLAPGARDHLLSETALRAFADRGRWLPSNAAASDLLSDAHLDALMRGYDAGRHTPAESFTPGPLQVRSDPYSAGFAVADRWGGAVACSFTLNGLFGSGRMAPGTGVLMAKPPQPGAASLTPVVIANDNTGDLRFAAVSSGGLAAPPALAAVMLETVDGELDMQRAVSRPRVAHVGAPDVTWYEPGVERERLEYLRARGHRLIEAPVIGGVIGFFCPQGLLDSSETCSIASDPRGYGLATRVE